MKAYLTIYFMKKERIICKIPKDKMEMMTQKYDDKR